MLAKNKDIDSSKGYIDVMGGDTKSTNVCTTLLLLYNICIKKKRWREKSKTLIL